LSKIFQSESLTPSLLEQSIHLVIEKLEEMQVKDGIALTSFKK
jgi:hypothetical protein